MQMGTPVICSNIPSRKEILKASATYFSPHDPKEMASVILSTIQNEPTRQELIKKGYEQIKQYSWRKMAEEISNVYLSCAND